ncbi:hypothetical protein NGTWS0302_18960 [Mycolicibacterium cyprinidarum]|uniref:Secreted protein n=1 Tax=Mycolicibacterium cyprinidarum TaxID=2860311 RepID=A0ABQ4V2G3_9MYCO|nr:hypothetical protein NGTWS1702_00660 [Mycolicibacterium sp. NGTWSNA01]GJF19917.1 hypothetical protein NGTWS0302_18960 [Mycolicibacterium sp. NGTWS0302]
MSWLLVALIPGLLMLATLGLDRVESSLRRDAISAIDVTEFLDQDEASDPDPLARSATNGAPRTLERRPNERDSAAAGLFYHIPMADLPTRQHLHDGANPGFQQTRHMNPV